MTFSTKTYLGAFIGIFLLGSYVQVTAQVTMSSPSIRCVAVDTAGDVTLTWEIAPNWNNTWINYEIYKEGNNKALDTITNRTQTSYTIPAAALLPSSANSAPISFYIVTSTSNGSPPNSDTVSSINLTVINTGSSGTAELYWNAISKPLPQGSSKWYQIYREYDSNNVWTWIDSTQSLSYIDTITYCSAFLNYQVTIADSTICVSTSNQVGSNTAFSCQIGPPQIVMDTVSVTSGNTVDITWAKSSKKNVIGYIIYYQEPSGSFTPIDTVYGINTDSLMNYLGGGNPSDSSLIFGVGALDSCKHAGPISNPERTLLLKVRPDNCAQNNTLMWNAYTNIDGSIGGYGIGGYRIFYSVNSGPFQFLAYTDANTRSYIDSNLTVREDRCYYIQVYDSVNHHITASSNIVCDSTEAPSLPKNNYLRTASVILTTSSIYILGYIDSLSGAEYYVFERSVDSTGGFSTIYTMNAPRHTDSISYIDNSASPTKKSYHYKIFTLDSCSKVIDSTNLGQTMFLNAVGQPNSTNILTWNDYRDWYDGPAYYSIYRSEDGVNYTLLTPSVKYSNAGENSYTDNITNITAGEGTFYYYIKAVENNSAAFYPFTDTSYSNIAEAYQEPIVYIPDAFCPLRGVNKIFKPVGVFIDSKDYNLSILDRWGTILFQSTDPDIGWDGTYKGSKIVQEGVYVYLLTYTSSRGEYFQRKGTVTLLK